MLPLAAIACAVLPAPAAAQVQPYQANDYRGFRNILPPGQGRTVNGAELLNFLTLGTMPSHSDDQRRMYGDLVYATPGLAGAQVDQFFKDGSFGVKPGDAGSTYSPKPGVTVIRDSSYGVPHIYGTTRPNLMFGAGYVGAEDRLFFMDALRHAGRAQLSGFIGGANKAMDAEQWDVAPYTEADLQRQIDLADEVYGAAGVQLREDLNNYVAGSEPVHNRGAGQPGASCPASTRALGMLPAPWKGTDVIATASLVGGIFGKGGGGELNNAEIYNAARARFGKVKGIKVWKDLRRANDPEAPTTVLEAPLPLSAAHQDQPQGRGDPRPGLAGARQPRRRHRPPPATPPGTRAAQEKNPEGTESPPRRAIGSLGELSGGSNALLVSGRESRSGHPLAVFGPQVSYFVPQILMEQDMHAPDFDARGVAFVGVNLFVLLGRGQDFAWSATSAGPGHHRHLRGEAL